MADLRGQFLRCSRHAVEGRMEGCMEAFNLWSHEMRLLSSACSAIMHPLTAALKNSRYSEPKPGLDSDLVPLA